MIDDLTPLHQLDDNILQSNANLFKPDISYRLAQSVDGESQIHY